MYIYGVSFMVIGKKMLFNSTHAPIHTPTSKTAGNSTYSHRSIQSKLLCQKRKNVLFFHPSSSINTRKAAAKQRGKRKDQTTSLQDQGFRRMHQILLQEMREHTSADVCCVARLQQQINVRLLTSFSREFSL